MRRMVLAAGLATAVAAHGGVCIKEGDRIGFLGDSITAYGNWDAGYLPLTQAEFEFIDADEGTFDEALQRRFIKMIEAEMKRR